ncbi:MAG: CPXCG motif-containing cysteine-rich protein [Aliivibrio sp.]|nr:CPXCG motif-containing cysteine-rich protein [Aliivibrio sp.]
MNDYTNQNIQCPNCQHSIDMLIDQKQSNKKIYDDCPSCHRAIEFTMEINPQNQSVNVTTNNEEDGLF